jgi:hypothetical protein
MCKSSQTVRLKIYVERQRQCQTVPIVQIRFTESQNERDIQATRQIVQETTAETTLSDTTESTPDIFRSPVVESEEAQTVSLDLVGNILVQASSQLSNLAWQRCLEGLSSE